MNGELCLSAEEKNYRIWGNFGGKNLKKIVKQRRRQSLEICGIQKPSGDYTDYK